MKVWRTVRDVLAALGAIATVISLFLLFREPRGKLVAEVNELDAPFPSSVRKKLESVIEFKNNDIIVRPDLDTALAEVAPLVREHLKQEANSLLGEGFWRSPDHVALIIVRNTGFAPLSEVEIRSDGLRGEAVRISRPGSAAVESDDVRDVVKIGPLQAQETVRVSIWGSGPRIIFPGNFQVVHSRGVGKIRYFRLGGSDPYERGVFIPYFGWYTILAVSLLITLWLRFTGWLFDGNRPTSKSAKKIVGERTGRQP
jgi:hypothetical protein